MAKRPKYDLFVSYAEADHAWVEGYLLDALKQAGVRSHSEAAFALGAPLLTEFENAVEQSKRTLLVLSPAYVADGFDSFTELLVQSYGVESGTWPVIPLVLEPVDLPPRLAMLTRLDATDEATWPDVIARLTETLQRPVPKDGTTERPPCPYPGMVPFTEADQERFFGRSEEAQTALEYLRLHPFLTVIGPSGSGRSSLVFAGLLPALRKSTLFGPGDWLVKIMRPGETPLTTLEATLGADPATPEQAVAAALATEPKARRVLLVIDQFEESFTVSQPEEVAPFHAALETLAATPQCFVVVTVRADFYPELMASSLWPQIKGHRLEVLPLDERGLRLAITRPAEDAGVYVEAALVERLVTDAAREPGVLPLVQETLVLLWEKLERRFLPLRAYEALVLPRRAYGPKSELGGAPRTGLQVAIARRADAALAALPAEQQVIARRIFLRLIQFGEGRADTRRQQPEAALRAAGEDAKAFDATLRHLVDARLLTVSGDEREARLVTAEHPGPSRNVDIAHEALIDGWPQLQRWLGERREAEQARRRLEAKTEEWVRLGRGQGALLDAAELAEAEHWMASQDAAEIGRSEALLMLIAASQEALNAAAQEREELRQRELEQAQVLLWEQQKHAHEINMGAVGTAATALAAIIGVLIAGPDVPPLAALGLAVGAIATMISLQLSIASLLPSRNPSLDLTRQIVTNSRIAARKLTLFRYALALYGFGVLFAAAAMALVAFLV
jgi:hypothetical protein